MPCGRAVKGRDHRHCTCCSERVDDTIWHFAEECSYLQPLRDWYGDLWWALGWTGDPPGFGQFLIYRHAPRHGDYTAMMAIHGAVLEAAKHARHGEVMAGARVGDIVKRAKARMRLQLRLDWKLATDGSSKRAETTMRPHGRAAFLKRWGALCWRGVGGRWEYDALVDPDAQ